MLRIFVATLALFAAAAAMACDDGPQARFERRAHERNMELMASEANTLAKERAIDAETERYLMRNYRGRDD